MLAKDLGMNLKRSRDADRDLMDIYLHGATRFGIRQSETYLE